jgi:hypothetical protein
VHEKQKVCIPSLAEPFLDPHAPEISGAGKFLKIPHPLPGSVSSLSNEQYRIYHPSIDKCVYYDSQTQQWHKTILSTKSLRSDFNGIAYWQPNHSIYLIVSLSWTSCYYSSNAFNDANQ